MAPLMTSISQRRPALQVEQERRPGLADRIAERAHVIDRVVEGERDSERAGAAVASMAHAVATAHAAGSSSTSPIVASSRAQVALKQTLQTSFSQTSAFTSSSVCTVNPAARQTSATRSRARRRRAPPLAEAYELHALVVGVARRNDRGTEAPGHPDQDAVVAHDPGHDVGAPEPVLDREHHRVGAEQRACRERRVVHVPRLGRDDDEIDRAHLVRPSSGVDADGQVAARSLHAEPALPDRRDVRLPRVDRPHLVSGAAEQRRIDRAHRPDADDGDLQRTPLTASCRRPAGSSLCAVIPHILAACTRRR